MNADADPGAGEADEPDDAALIARLARCAAELYRAVPVEGAGLTAHAEEVAHAADLDLLAANLDLGADVNLDATLRPEDIRTVCRLLIDVRRNPRDRDPAEVAIARAAFPEVEAASLDPLEALIGFYTGLLRS
jgi:hypothetical protein